MSDVQAVVAVNSTPEKALAFVMSSLAVVFGPVVGFFKGRALWQYGIMAALFVSTALFRAEIKAILVTILLTLPFVLSGYINRKLANPEFSVNELIGERDKETRKLLAPIIPAHAEIIKTLLWVQAVYTVMSFAAGIYLLAAIYDKVK